MMLLPRVQVSAVVIVWSSSPTEQAARTVTPVRARAVMRVR
ncbi:hypothetical protein [Actinoplanes lobatus]|uniref:Uncharacterized protein n=1 Tax=Actinoplanes lobatus TaxID=113568 RepID=A0A7W7HLS1_9ACTN|nr:hypothetical protein [Actinoplanes lobatus]MBB4752557.1 hypothetical protein [Actinoplanes lobatus]